MAAEKDSANTQVVCERAWQSKQDIAVAVEAARHALIARDRSALERWASRAPETIEGARILHFWGELQQELGDMAGAEKVLRHALALRIDRDPKRALNTAQALFQVIHGVRPAEESIQLALTAWQQAKRAGDPTSSSLAAVQLIWLLIDLGEMKTAQALLAEMPTVPAVLHDLAEGYIQAARGRRSLAIQLFERATKSADGPALWSAIAQMELVQELVRDNRVPDARSRLDTAVALYLQEQNSLDGDATVAAARAMVDLAEGRVDDALSVIAVALTTPSRDAARVRLLTLQGDALAKRRDLHGAVGAWRAAAEMLESWRASIPSTQLRGGLVAHQRHALESWLDSAGERGDIHDALDIVQRILGRALLDRLRQREANRTSIDASIRDVVQRLATNRELAQVPQHHLASSKHPLVAFMVGASSVWAIRHVDGEWSITRVGDRQRILDLVDAYTRNVDDVATAEQLGAALFPTPPHDSNVVLLDNALSEIPLAGLRSRGRYLVEYAPILELLAPDLLFEDVHPRTGTPVVVGDPLGDLSEARQEAHTVASRIGGREFIGAQATRESLVVAKDAMLLHVAAHSTISDGRAALVLHDRPLSAIELIALKVGPRVAVIATCRSQVADDPATSLAAAFLAAGSSGVIGVKRSLPDAEGAAMMQYFYAAGGAKDPFAALAEAQRTAIRQRRPPSTWAVVSFFGVGGWLDRKDLQ